RCHVLEALAVPDRGAIDEDVEAAKTFSRPLDQLGDRVLVRQVGGKGLRLDAAAAQKLNSRSRFRARGSIVNRDRIAASGQGVGNMPADAALAAARDQRDLGSR